MGLDFEKCSCVWILIFTGFQSGKIFRWTFIRQCNCQGDSLWYSTIMHISDHIILFNFWGTTVHVIIFCPVHKGLPYFIFNITYCRLSNFSTYIMRLMPYTWLVNLLLQKHSLFRQIFVIYKSTSKAVKQVQFISGLWLSYLDIQHSCYELVFLIICMVQAVHRHIPILVRTIGSSPELLEIISDPPPGSKNLLTQVLIIIYFTRWMQKIQVTKPSFASPCGRFYAHWQMGQFLLQN